MTYLAPAFLCDLVEHWWHAVAERVDDLLARLAPPEGPPEGSPEGQSEGPPEGPPEGKTAPRLLPVEARAISGALDLFEAMVRRMLVLVSAERGPAPAAPEHGTLLFRIDEALPAPTISKPRADDPDFHLTPLPDRHPPEDRLPTDGLVSAARILKRLHALVHVFDHAELYIDAMRARLGALLPPLTASLPPPFTDDACSPDLAGKLHALHEEALRAQAADTS